MDSTTTRIHKDLQTELKRFQKIASEKLGKDVTFVIASQLISKMLNEMDLENIDLKKIALNGKRPSKHGLKKICMEIEELSKKLEFRL